MPVLLFELIAALLSMAGGSLWVNSELRNLTRVILNKLDLLPKNEELPYTEKIESLTVNMLKASREMDELLAEFAQTTINRKETMEKVELHP